MFDHIDSLLDMQIKQPNNIKIRIKKFCENLFSEAEVKQDELKITKDFDTQKFESNRKGNLLLSTLENFSKVGQSVSKELLHRILASFHVSLTAGKNSVIPLEQFVSLVCFLQHKSFRGEKLIDQWMKILAPNSEVRQPLNEFKKSMRMLADSNLIHHEMHLISENFADRVAMKLKQLGVVENEDTFLARKQQEENMQLVSSNLITIKKKPKFTNSSSKSMMSLHNYSFRGSPTQANHEQLAFIDRSRSLESIEPGSETGTLYSDRMMDAHKIVDMTKLRSLLVRGVLSIEIFNQCLRPTCDLEV